MKKIHELVERYRKDPITRKAYMTLEQELDLWYRKGRKEEKQATARKMLAKQMPIAEIIELTDLSESEVLALQNEVKSA